MAIENSVLRIKRDHTVHVEWEIPKFFDIPNAVSQYFDSPPFLLCDAEWNIRIYPNLSCHIFLEVRKKCSSNSHHVSFTIGIKSDVSVLKIFHGDKLFLKKEETWEPEPSFPRSELNDTGNVVAHKDTLTVFLSVCILDGVTESELVESACQTSTHEGFETLSQNFKELFVNGAQSDVTFKVNDKEFLAHKLVLGARSTVFHAMFKSDMVEKNNGIVNISDSDPAHFENFLLYLYSGKLDVVLPGNALGLYLLADKYNIPELKKTCCDCLASEISADSFCDVALLASLHNESELLKTAIDFFTEHANIIFPTPKWTSFLGEHLTLANELLINMANKYIK